MVKEYPKVITRFLNKEERLIASAETEMPLVIEAADACDLPFLHHFLATHAAEIHQDIAQYGAVLLRGFDIHSEEDFEKTILSIDGMQGISEAFMSEEGRVPVGNLRYVLHTNAVYKTGGTLYLGGFHSENYYSTDVPTYINFCCFHPSDIGGETGLVNMEKIYAELDPVLQNKLENNTFFVDKWLISEVAERYQISATAIEQICQKFDLPLIGEEKNKCILMYKPSVIKHPVTDKKSLFINLFEIIPLNAELRKRFMHDYTDKIWYWHRFFWKMPHYALKMIETVYIMFASFFHSPKNALQIVTNKIKKYRAEKTFASYNKAKVGSCFNREEIQTLALLIRKYYSSCLWQKGDILLVDNRKVMHAGMPGAGARRVRAMICNPLDLTYSFQTPGFIEVKTKSPEETVGFAVKND